MNEKVISIAQIFPDFEEKIDFLFQTDENFRDLCADHILCVGIVQELENEKNKNPEKTQEYQDLKKSLEQEILAIITKR